MRTTPWAAYTPRMMLDLIGFAVFLLLILFVLTLVCVGGFYVLRIIREYFCARPFAAFEKKAAAAIQATDLGWLAIVCGPLLGLFIFLPVLPISLFVGPAPDHFYEIPLFLLLLIGLGALAGAITAGAFWVSSALLGNVRKATKRLRGVRDPEFDEPF
jgi:hypothetical protein